MRSKRWWDFGSITLFVLVLLAMAGGYGYRRYLDHALGRALDAGKWRTVKSLVRSGADPHRTGEFGSTVVEAAIYLDDPIFLQYVLQRGPDQRPRSETGTTPFIRSAEAGSNACVRALLAAGTDVNSVDAIRGTALMGAAAGNRVETLRLLLRRGASIQARDEAGNTALMHAANGWHAEAVDLLLAAGADPNVHNVKGSTALTLARTYRPDDHDLPTSEEKVAQRQILALLARSSRAKSGSR